MGWHARGAKSRGARCGCFSGRSAAEIRRLEKASNWLVTLVTGATGLVGNNVVRRLLEQGAAVRVLARENIDPRPLAGLEVEIARGDVRDAAAVSQAVRGTDCVIHAAGHVHIGWKGMDTARTINVEGTRNIAQAARSADARLVHVSSIDALGISTTKRTVDEETPPTGGVLCPYVIDESKGERRAGRAARGGPGIAGLDRQSGEIER